MAIIEVTDHELDQEQRAHAAAFFHALADPMRLMILDHLRTGEHKVKELTEHLGLAQSTVSAHLACLREGGLVQARAQGRASFYSLTDEQALADLLERARIMSADAGGHQWHEHHLPAGE